jgi:hypothetical protein
MIKLSLAIISLLGFTFFFANADESIPITFSGTIENVVFDGKWSFEYEWKQSSLNTYLYEDGNKMIILRSAHHGNYVYILIDSVNDESLDNNLDSATICFDSVNNKSIALDSDDYCFTSMLGSSTGITLHGGDGDSFKQIDNRSDFVAIGGISDQHDRYSSVPHVSYEFKIPIDLIGRSNVYGFYFLVYDDHTKKYYTYPTNLVFDGNVSTPNNWGEIYSPDKSLPEFYMPFLVIILGFVIMIFLNRSKIFYQQI